jgi:hypothetical protein
VQAQASAVVDRDIVKRYEAFVARHADLTADAQARVDRGRDTDQDREFLRKYREVQAAQAAVV